MPIWQGILQDRIFVDYLSPQSAERGMVGYQKRKGEHDGCTKMLSSSSKDSCTMQKGAKCRKMPCVNLVNALDQEVKDAEATQTCTDQTHKLPISIRAMRFAMQKNSED